MSRLPIRIRLTSVFVIVMALLLLATGAFVHHRQAADLNRAVDTGLRARAQEIAALLDATDGVLESVPAGLVTRAGDFGQVIDDRGRQFDLSSARAGLALLTPAQLQRAQAGAMTIALEHVPGLSGPLRVFARPRAVEDHHFVIVVATSLTDRDETLRSLTHELLLGGGAALLLAALAGFAVASAALRPVEAMRARAASISDLRSGDRLPEPPTQDEVGRLARTLNEMLDRLEQVLARERAFVDDASHELRTPLTILRTELELALSAPRTVAELQASLRSVGEETENLIRLADDLLLLARADSRELATTREPVAVADLLAQAYAQASAQAAAEAMARSAPQRSLDLLPADPAIVTVDRLAVQRAIANLLDNAVRHGRGTVTLSARSRPGQVEIDVDDQGGGLDEGFAPHAFERFVRSPEARGSPGTGLGLAIVAAVARAHDGTAGIGRAPAGPGTRAWITLPVVDRAADPV